MEKDNQVSLTNISEKLSKKNLTTVTKPILKDGNKLSVYSGSLTLDVFLRQLNRLRKTFPSLDNHWVDTLKDRLKANHFTDERLIDAVDNLLDHFKYGHTPNIAEIISYDKTIDAYTHDQMLKLLNDDQTTFARYVTIDIGGNPRYILREYQLKYNLNLYHIPQQPAQKIFQEISDEERLATAQIIKKTLEQLNRTTNKGS